MKHLIKKDLFQGGGKSKPKPTPALLKPPKLDNYEILNSYSVAEVVDLISDGPIEGLVNQNGERLITDILQGVYLDNTPVQQTSAGSNTIINESDIIGSKNISDRLNKLGDVYYQNNQYTTSYHKPVLNLNGIINTNLPERRLLATKAKTQNVTNVKDIKYFSPLIFKNNANGGVLDKNNEGDVGWKWVGDIKNDDPRYFKTNNGDVEVHYEDPKKSIFFTGSLMSQLETSLSLKDPTKVYQNKFMDDVAKKIQAFKGKINNAVFDWTAKNVAYVVVQIGTKDSSFALNIGSILNKSIFGNTSGNTSVIQDTSFELKNFSSRIPQNQIHKFLIPVLDDDNQYTDKVYGCLLIEIPTTYAENDGEVKTYSESTNQTLTSSYYYIRQFFSDLSGFIRSNTELIFKIGRESSYQSKQDKFNFLNIACEFKNGEEYQKPLQYFENVYIDYDYTAQLTGPFKAGYATRRIDGEWKSDDRGPQNPKLNISLNQEEGSNDVRDSTVANKRESYSDWNNDNEYDEDPTPITHTIENPEVSSVFFTLAVSNLSDTVAKSTSNERSLGDKTPAIVEIEVEWGKISNGEKSKVKSKKYAVVAMVEGQMLIDFGSPDLESIQNDYFKSVRDISADRFDPSVLARPFELPALTNDENPSTVKRYIKVTKLSAETNSILLKKEIALYKVTEIIKQNLSYPFSAIAGIKIDARTFGSVPERTYDCRLKLVQIPTNYKPLDARGLDQRYIQSANQYTEPSLIYDGDWDGSFVEGWTDNPAWILYDLLTSKRYGLGAYLDESQINKWELYKIGRFCDAVDENGYFQGVPDGIGGLEPRYSCNILFNEQTKIFDAINIVASLFRGSVFFSNSEIHFLDDRPRTPIALFTNSNVKNGIFNYINNRRDLQFNTVEVAYLDRFDNYQTKIEYIQDESDIRQRGVFKTDINSLGVTSRAMARRIGQHLIYQTIKENQSVEFSAGLESLLCRPGDLVVIEDEMKTLSSNYGRILEINTAEKSLRLDNFYDTGSFTGKITVYTPTGVATNADLSGLASAKRNRIPYFDVVTGLINSDDNILTGRYYFSNYVTGYPTGYPTAENSLPTQFPLYTGVSSTNNDLYCYYNTGVTGFVFSTGFAYANNNLYDKVITNTGITDITELISSSGFESGARTGFRYDSSVATRRGALSGDIGNNLDIPFNSYEGILETEISTVNNPQITTFTLTGNTGFDYGCKVLLDAGDVNINLLPMIAQGSTYRIQRQNATDQIYKVISIREQNQNEYTVSASKYDTGKFQEIENHITSDYLPQTYASQQAQAAIGLQTLAAPAITQFTTGATGATFNLTGQWSGVAGATGYSTSVYLETNNITYNSTTSSTGLLITGLSTFGYWKMSVQAIGNNSTYINSPVAQSGFSVLYNNSLATLYDRSFITTISI
jgi:predicted phage tail protein